MAKIRPASLILSILLLVSHILQALSPAGPLPFGWIQSAQAD